MEETKMDLKIIPPKDYLPVVAALAGCVLIIFLGTLTYAKIKEARYIGQSSQYKNTITVSGQGKAVGAPDIGQVSLSVISQAGTVEGAQRDNTQKMEKIIQAMKDLGIKEEDLKTTGYNISPRYQYISGRSNIIGYEVTQSLEVKIRDLAKSGDILGKAAEAGANQVGSLSFTFDDPDKLKSDARKEAIKEAKEKAEDLADSLGVSLGKITNFNESSGGDQPAPVFNEMARSAYGMGGAAAPDIQTGQNEIIVNVSLAYEIY